MSLRSKPIPPRLPLPEECCGGECGKACILEVYERKKERYQVQLAEWEEHEKSANSTKPFSSPVAAPSKTESASDVTPTSSSTPISTSSPTSADFPETRRYRASSLTSRFLPLAADRYQVSLWGLTLATFYFLAVLVLSQSLPSLLALPLPLFLCWLVRHKHPRLFESLFVLGSLPLFESRFYLEEHLLPLQEDHFSRNQRTSLLL